MLFYSERSELKNLGRAAKPPVGANWSCWWIRFISSHQENIRSNQVKKKKHSFCFFLKSESVTRLFFCWERKELRNVCSVGCESSFATIVFHLYLCCSIITFRTKKTRRKNKGTFFFFTFFRFLGCILACKLFLYYSLFFLFLPLFCEKFLRYGWSSIVFFLKKVRELSLVLHMGY